MRGGLQLLVSTLVLGGFACLFVLHPFTPSLPLPGLDPSWVAAMGEAADRPARWGIDTAFTYGPASPLVTVYYNGAYFTRTLPLLLGFSLLFGWCAALLVAAGRSKRRAAAGTAVVALMLVAARGTADALFLSLPFLIFLLALRRRGPADAAASRVGAVAMGLTAMVKMSFPLAALPLVLIADATALSRRRLPWLLPLFALGVVCGALLYGQRLSDLPAYVAMQGEVVAGYAAAMAIDGPDWDILSFLVVAPALVATALLAGPQGRRERATVALGLAVTLLFLFKAGFIRHDLHSLIAWSGLGLVAAVLAGARLPRRTAVAVAGVACFIAVAYEPIMTVRQSVRGGDNRGAALARLYAGALRDGPPREAAAAWALLRDPAAFRASLDAAKAAAWAAITRAAPLPALAGTVDVLPSQQSAVMAAGLAYHGRPSFQEYSTYTSGLMAANRAFVQGRGAPRWILFGPESPQGYMTLDQRFPGFAEGALWPDLLRLYRPDHRVGALLALERRAAPVPLPMGAPEETSLAFGRFTPMPAGPAPLWASLDIRLNLAGRLVSALFRPPLLTLAVRLADGGERRFRLVPAMARAGFLLSPLVDNASDYEVLAAGREAGAARRVTAIAVEVEGAGRLFYAADIGLSLRRMDTSRLAGPATSEAPVANAWEALAAADASPSADRVNAPPSGPAPASGLVSLPLWRLPAVDGTRSVSLGYGLGEAAVGTVCFSAEAADGTARTLWRRCLDPKGDGEGPEGGEESPQGAGRGLETAAFAVPEGVTEVVLGTRCTAGCKSGDAYWTQPPAE